ncbi:hypothetical protein P376_4891 [Streptomyces sp. HCCB10043]|nr:hypothetical protein P376_4891 [Streptomyces sp. HCCB10043]
MGAREVGNETETGLTHGELHVLGDDPQIAGEGELEAGADGVALDRRDRHEVVAAPPGERLLVLGDGRVELGLRAARHVEERRLAVEALGGEGLPVEARGEGLALAAEHHDPHRAGQRPSGLGQRPPQSGRLSVALGRVGERHRGDGIVDGEPYAVLVEHSVERGHGAPPDRVQSALRN